MVSVKINEVLYPAEISGRVTDKDWDNRESKSITLEMSYADAMALFVDDLDWEIVYENGETTEVYDNSELSLAGPITDNRNGTVTVKMGKPTAEEILTAILGG